MCERFVQWFLCFLRGNYHDSLLLEHMEHVYLVIIERLKKSHVKESEDLLKKRICRTNSSVNKTYLVSEFSLCTMAVE